MERLNRVRYTHEFKLQAVQMVDEEGLGVTEVARRLSMSAKTLENWVTAFRKEGKLVNRQKSPRRSKNSPGYGRKTSSSKWSVRY